MMNNPGYIVMYGPKDKYPQDYWELPVCVTGSLSMANQIIGDLNKFFEEASPIADRDWCEDSDYPSDELSNLIASASNKFKRKYGVNFDIFDTKLWIYLLDYPKAWVCETVMVPARHYAVAAMALS